MKQRVVYFTDSPTFGGSEQAILILLAALDRSRWEPVVVHHPEAGVAPLAAGAASLGVRTWAIPRMLGQDGLRHLVSFVRDLRALQPAVFHAHLVQPLACMYPRLAAILAGVPAVVATEHLFVEVPWQRPLRAEQLLARGMDRYIAVSHALARRLREAVDLPAEKLQVVHNGIPLAPYAATTPQTHAWRPSNTRQRPRVLTVARLHPQKGLSYLLRAACSVSDATFALAGDGPEREALETEVRERGLADRVVFLGHRTDVPALLAQSDLFVLPSLFEGLPLSVLEAMAAGKPVIATAVGGTGEAVTDGETGLLVPPADSAALASAIQRVLSDPALSHRLGAAGQARAQQEFSAETMSRRTTDIYAEILETRGGSRSRRWAGRLADL
ncbi:MAG: glycosyltransferase family 4 protein [Anaerolineae bacterium]